MIWDNSYPRRALNRNVRLIARVLPGNDAAPDEDLADLTCAGDAGDKSIRPGLRFSYANSIENIEEGLGRVRSWLEANPR